MRIFGIVVIKADRLTDEFWSGFRLGHRSCRHYTISLLKRPLSAGDTDTASRILTEIATTDPTDIGPPPDRLRP